MWSPISMKYLAGVLFLSFYCTICFGQTGKIIENQATLFSITTKKDTIDFIVVDTILNQKKPVFLWCQGSLPLPLFCEIEGYGYYFFGGGVSNFNYKKICQDFHLVIISMPKTPVLAGKKNLNSRYQYVPNPEKPNEFLHEYIAADFIENYVSRADVVLKFLKKQKWVRKDKLVIAGHSQGTKVATKIAVHNPDVTHLGMFAANPFGRIDQFVREARLDAQLGKTTWQKADSVINETYEFYRQVNNPDSIAANPGLKSWKTFSETYYDDWLTLNIPIYLAYGTEDRVADLCDLVPLFFIGRNKNNLTLKRYPGLEHNFFEVDKNGRALHEKGHWEEVINEFITWIK